MSSSEGLNAMVKLPPTEVRPNRPSILANWLLLSMRALPPTALSLISPSTAVNLSLWETLKWPPIVLEEGQPLEIDEFVVVADGDVSAHRGEVVQPFKVFEALVVVDGEVAIDGAKLVQALKKGAVYARNFEVASNGVIAPSLLIEGIRVFARAHDAVARQNVAFTIAVCGAIHARVLAAPGQDEQQDEQAGHSGQSRYPRARRRSWRISASPAVAP